MSEYASSNPEQDPLIPVEDVLREMTPDGLIHEKRRLLYEISDRETLVLMINKVQEESGCPVELIN